MPDVLRGSPECVPDRWYDFRMMFVRSHLLPYYRAQFRPGLSDVEDIFFAVRDQATLAGFDDPR